MRTRKRCAASWSRRWPASVTACSWQPKAARLALTLAERHSGAIEVLLTDVVLPGINGRELADRFRIARPDTKVIYTSGYTQDIIAYRGVLHDDISYIPKPYTADQIAAKVREAIGRD